MRGIRRRGRALTGVTVAALLGVAAPVIAVSSAGAATDPAGPGVPISKGVTCLPGTWNLILPSSPAGLSGQQTTSEGAVTLQIGPGRTLVETFASAVSAGQPGPGGTYLQTRDETTGTVTADWTATAHKLTLRHVRNDTTSVSTVTIDQRTSEPATESPAPQTFKARKQTIGYTCAGDTLKLASVRGLRQGFTRTG